MIYKSYEDMADCIRRNLWKVPHDVDLIVGIPRSGMIPALMIAEFMNKRCIDIDSFIEGRTGYIGNRGNMIRESGTDKVLVVDDSVAAGTAMRKAKEQLEPFKDKYTLLFCCVYAENPESVSIVDICLENIYNPNDKKHRKEWNILHLYPKHTETSMWDIDGLLCKDPPDDKDTEQYEAYLSNALPMITPATTIGAIVTYRIEPYREVTEKWLKEQGITYNRLYMFPAPDRETRNISQGPAMYKAIIYKEASWAKLFMESSARQAEKICRIARKPVFCYENGKLYQ